jgi:predicted transcriptional regulator of viral defense system
MALAQTYRRCLIERAHDQYGYVTTRDAAELGIPPVELRKLAQRGGLRHVARGVYRFDEVPTTAHDQFMEAVLAVGPGAHLTGDAVLLLHNLGLVNPRKIRVGTDRRVRGQLPAFVDVVREPVEPKDVTVYEGIPSTTLERALIACRGTVMGDRLVDATKEAARRGLLLKKAEQRVLNAVGADA